MPTGKIKLTHIRCALKLQNIQKGKQMRKNTHWPCESAHCRVRRAGDILCTEPGTPDERRKNIMGQTKPAAGLKSLNRAADTLSTLLAQEVKELNERQKAARRENTPDPGMMKGLKEATAVLKDLAGVVKTLNDQGTELEGTECGVVLLPPVEQEEKE
jgi:hypothetical protein